jgi:hypothetical protein
VTAISRELAVLKELEARIKGPARGPLPMPDGLTVDRCRMLGLKLERLPHASIYPLEDSTTRKGYAAETPLMVKIACWVKGTSGPVDEEVDAVWLWIHQQVMADESLGGLTIGIQLASKDWGFHLAQAPVGDLDLHYLITFRHHSADPTRPA